MSDKIENRFDNLKKEIYDELDIRFGKQSDDMDIKFVRHESMMKDLVMDLATKFGRLNVGVGTNDSTDEVSPVGDKNPPSVERPKEFPALQVQVDNVGSPPGSLKEGKKTPEKENKNEFGPNWKMESIKKWAKITYTGMKFSPDPEAGVHPLDFVVSFNNFCEAYGISSEEDKWGVFWNALDWEGKAGQVLTRWFGRLEREAKMDDVVQSLIVRFTPEKDLKIALFMVALGTVEQGVNELVEFAESFVDKIRRLELLKAVEAKRLGRTFSITKEMKVSPDNEDMLLCFVSGITDRVMKEQALNFLNEKTWYGDPMATVVLKIADHVVGQEAKLTRDRYAFSDSAPPYSARSGGSELNTPKSVTTDTTLYSPSGAYKSSQVDKPPPRNFGSAPKPYGKTPYDPSTRTCYGCGQTGHMKNDPKCPNYNKQVSFKEKDANNNNPRVNYVGYDQYDEEHDQYPEEYDQDFRPESQ